MTTIIRILAAIILASTALGASAQAKIDKCIRQLEGRPDVTATYTERRTPKKHKLYRVTIILNFNNVDYYNQLVAAFETERQNTISAVKTNNTIIYKFDGDHDQCTYTLSNSGGTYSLVKSWRSSDDPSDTSSIDAVFDSVGDAEIELARCNLTQGRRAIEEVRRSLQQNHIVLVTETSN